jgi:phage tail protein X
MSNLVEQDNRDYWVTQFAIWHEVGGEIDKSQPPVAKYSGIVTVYLPDVPTTYTAEEYALEWLECQIRGLLTEEFQDGNYGIAAYQNICPAPLFVTGVEL